MKAMPRNNLRRNCPKLKNFLNTDSRKKSKNSKKFMSFYLNLYNNKTKTILILCKYNFI